MKRFLTIATSLLMAGGLVLSNSVISYAAPKVDPYNTVQAELMFESSGVETARGISGQVYVKGIDAGDYFKVKDVDFNKGVGSMTVQVRTTAPAVFEVRKGSVDGEKLATFRVSDTQGEFRSFTALMSGVDEGKNVIYFVGKYGTFDFDYWSCAEKKEMPPIPVTDPEPEPTPDPEHIVEPVESDMALEYQINSWGTGYTVNFKVKNEGAAVDTWTLKLAKSDVVIDSSWCVNVASEGDYYVITPMSWNSQLGTGASADFGIMGSGSIGTTVDYTFE